MEENKNIKILRKKFTIGKTEIIKLENAENGRIIANRKNRLWKL